MVLVLDKLMINNSTIRETQAQQIVSLSSKEKWETHRQRNGRVQTCHDNVLWKLVTQTRRRDIHVLSLSPSLSLSLSLFVSLTRGKDDNCDKRNSQIFNLHDGFRDQSTENSSRHRDSTDLSERGRRLTGAIDVLQAVEASITIRSCCFISRLSISRFQCVG